MHLVDKLQDEAAAAVSVETLTHFNQHHILNPSFNKVQTSCWETHPTVLSQFSQGLFTDQILYSFLYINSALFFSSSVCIGVVNTEQIPDTFLKTETYGKKWKISCFAVKLQKKPDSKNVHFSTVF